jgi:antitoxin (DNA-binding transcriptional repressor) of toxin-antitoxin stability system
MRAFNIHEAKTQLSKLVNMAVKGEPFIIAKAGKPLVKVERIAVSPPQRLGFMEGAFEVPDDIDTMFADEIQALFHGQDPITAKGSDKK